MRYNNLLILLLIICCYGCRSVPPPPDKGFPIVSVATYLRNDTYIIAVEAKAHSKITATQYLHRKAREIAQKNGYIRYEVLEIGTEDKKGVVGFIDDPEVAEKLYGKIKFYTEGESPPPF